MIESFVGLVSYVLVWCIRGLDMVVVTSFAVNGIIVWYEGLRYIGLLD